MSEIKAPMIYGKIADCMRQLGAIGKTSKNAQQGFMYRGVDAVMNALNPVLTANHVFCVPEVLEQHREERQTRNGGNLIYSILKMCYTLYAEDGSSVSATVIGEGMDSADKSSNKAMSVAYKYAMFQIFSIPTEEMADPDADMPPESTPKIDNKAARNNAWTALASALGKTNKEMSACVNSLIQANLAPNKPLTEYTDSEYGKLLDGIAANFRAAGDDAA
nr:MAG TPA: ERF superfamily protein [Caudoviricetes sp.]